MEHATRGMAFGSTNQGIQRLARLNWQLFLEQSFAFINLRGHVVNGYSNLFFTVIHLPEGRHHAFVARKWRVVYVNATQWRQSQKLLFQNVRAGNGHQEVRSETCNPASVLFFVWIADEFMGNAQCTADLGNGVKPFHALLCGQGGHDFRLEGPQKETRQAARAIEAMQPPQPVYALAAAQGF